MLEDFESYQLKRSSVGYYGILLLVFVIITLLIALNKTKNYIGSHKLFKGIGTSIFDSFWQDKAFIVLLFVLMVFHFFYLISRRYFIKVNGKYNSIEFRVRGFKNPSIRKMLDRLVEQSNIRKQAKGKSSTELPNPERSVAT